MIPSSHYERGITQNMYFLFSADAHTRRSHPQCHCGNVPPQSDHLKNTAWKSPPFSSHQYPSTFHACGIKFSLNLCQEHGLYLRKIVHTTIFIYAQMTQKIIDGGYPTLLIFPDIVAGTYSMVICVIGLWNQMSFLTSTK